MSRMAGAWLDPDAFESVLHGVYRHVSADPPTSMRLDIRGFADPLCTYPARFHFAGYCAPAPKRLSRL